MADVSTEVAAILAAKKGEEVRGSIATAITKINDNVTHENAEAQAWATGGTGGTPSDENNAEYFASLAQQYASAAGSAVPQDYSDLVQATLESYPMREVSGSPAVLENAANNVPIDSMTIGINAVQGEGTPTPENPIAISGFTGITITASGRNLCGGDMMRDEFLTKNKSGSSSIMTDYPTGRYVRRNSSTTTDGTLMATGLYKEHTSYTIMIAFKIGSTSYKGSYLQVVYTDDTTETFSAGGSSATTLYKRTIVTDPEKTVAGLRLTPSVSNNSYRPYYYYDEFGIFEGEQSTLEPWYGTNSASVSFGKTVWGGEYDAKTGILTETHAQIASYAGETLPGAWVSSMDVYTPGGTPTTGAQVVYELDSSAYVKTALLTTSLNSVGGTCIVTASTGPIDLIGRTRPVGFYELEEETETDKTLSIDDKPADAAETGANIRMLRKAALSAYDSATADGSSVQLDDAVIDVPLIGAKVTVIPSQDGSGTPSADLTTPANSNYRGIRLIDTIQLSQYTTDPNNPTVYSFELPASAGVTYGCTYDFATGILAITHKKVTLGTGYKPLAHPGSDTSFYDYYYEDSTADCIISGHKKTLPTDKAAEAGIVCTIAPYVTIDERKASEEEYTLTFWCYISGSSPYSLQPRITFPRETAYDSVSKANAVLKSFADAGKPCEIVYKWKNPAQYQFYVDPQTVIIKTGSDTFSVDGDEKTLNVVYPINAEGRGGSGSSFREDQLARCEAAHRKFSQKTRGGDPIPFNPLIVHISDIHSDATRMNRALDLADKIGADTLCLTGDLVEDSPSDGFAYLHAAIAAHTTKPVICTGNHDVGDGSLADSSVYSKIFAPSIDRLMTDAEQEVAPGKCWYYTDSSAALLRYISIHLYELGGSRRDFTHLSEDQLEWFASALSSTPSGYGIIVLVHSTRYLSAKAAGYEKFYDSHSFGYIDTHYQDAFSGDPISDIITAFNARGTHTQTYTQTGSPSSLSVDVDFSEVAPAANNGPEFIACLTGHIHEDRLGLVPKSDYTRRDDWILNLNVAAAKMYPTERGIPRTNTGYLQDCINVYGIDRAAKTVKVVRVGSDLRHDLTYSDVMVIPYTEPGV